MANVSDPVVIALIGGVAGLLSGTLASIIAPWINWGIEKRRKKHDYRVELIKRWRTVLGDPQFERSLIVSNSDYGALEALLTDKALEQLRRPFGNASSRILSVGTGFVDNIDRSLLQREIARIEREWELV